MLNFILFERVFVSITGHSGGKCTEDSPCSCEKSMNKFNLGDTLVLADSYLEGLENTKKFRTIVNVAIKKGMNVDCSNIIVNGTNSEHFSPAFIVFPSNYYGSFANAVFSNFKTTVFSITGVKESVFENITFQNCEMKWRASLIRIEESSIQMSNFLFHQIIENDLPMIEAEKSSLTIHESKIFHCFAIQGMKVPLLLLRNTNMFIHRSQFAYVNTPVSPMFRSEGTGRINIVGSSFVGGTHTSIIYVHGSAEVSIQNSKFEDSKAAIFESKEGSSLMVKNTSFTNCGSSEKALLYVLRSKGLIIASNFTNCAAPVLIGSIGSSKLTVRDTLFENCKPKHSCVTADVHGYAEIHDCMFTNTISKDSVISSERNSNILINTSVFASSWSPAILLSASAANVRNSSFRDSFAEGKRSVLGDKSTLNMKWCNFYDSSLGGLILNSGRNKLRELTFNTTRERSIPNSLQLMCIDCKFIEVHETAEYDKQAIIITLICAIVASSFAMFGKDHLYVIMRYCFSNRKND